MSSMVSGVSLPADRTSLINILILDRLSFCGYVIASFFASVVDRKVINHRPIGCLEFSSKTEDQYQAQEERKVIAIIAYDAPKEYM